MLLAVLSGFLVAASLLFFGKRPKGRLSVLLALLPLSLFCTLAACCPG
jgi:hypothetical protein